RLSRERRRSCEPRRVQAGTADLLRGQGADEKERDRRDRGEEERPSHRRPPGAGWPGAFVAADAGTTLTAHFLKSVCFEIGSVASSVTLLMSWLASKNGTNTRPTAMRWRPRVSTRVRISPRRDTTRTSWPRWSPRRCASSG